MKLHTGIVAHQELQSIIGQVMDTFRDRIFGLPGATDDIPSPIVIRVGLRFGHPSKH